jgi:hypothetical protein
MRSFVLDWHMEAQIFGSSACTVTGSTVTGSGYTPVLDACRRLLQAGHPSSASLTAYRGDTLCLHVRSIGQAAQLTVVSAGNGRPIFTAREGFTTSQGEFPGQAATGVASST